MILATTADLKKHISIAQSFQFTDFEPYINKALNAFVRKYVGNLHVFLKDAFADDAPDASIKNEAREHLQNAIANFGYFIYLPFSSVMMDSSGISVVNSDQRKTAEWWQLKDIRRELLRSGHEAMDLLLEVLEQNPLIFTDWTEKFGTENRELLVYNTEIFNKYYHIFGSRQTFLALQPSILQVEDQYLHTMLSSELVEVLKIEATGNIKALKIAMQKAIVAFTVAKVASVGLFILDENGLRVSFDSQIDSKKENVNNGKPSDQLMNLITEQINNGTQYLNVAKEIITANPDDFTAFELPLLNSKITGSGFKAYDTKGVFSL
jgi:hypothetical protein